MGARDFWQMHPIELHWLIEVKMPVKMYGKMTEHEVEEIYADMEMWGML